MFEVIAQEMDVSTLFHAVSGFSPSRLWAAVLADGRCLWPVALAGVQRGHLPSLLTANWPGAARESEWNRTTAENALKPPMIREQSDHRAQGFGGRINPVVGCDWLFVRDAGPCRPMVHPSSCRRKSGLRRQSAHPLLPMPPPPESAVVCMPLRFRAQQLPRRMLTYARSGHVVVERTSHFGGVQGKWVASSQHRQQHSARFVDERRVDLPRVCPSS